MIKNERLHIAVKAGSPPETCFYSNIDPLDPHCCNSRSLGATCFYSNMEPTRNVNKLRTERARWIHNAVKTGVLKKQASKVAHNRP
jgi:hypothetical protein